MQRDGTVEIVLGEAEPDAGILRMVLEAEGFHIVGHASSDEELERVLGWVHPSVIVLDVGISASAVLDARRRANGAAVVVVWPPDVTAIVAEERVDPQRVFQDLGEAVRRAASRTDDHEELVIRIPDLVEEPLGTASVARIDDDPDRDREPISTRRWMRVLVTAATWILFLTALTTIAIAVPSALFRERVANPVPHSLPARTPAPTTQPASADRAAVAPTSPACEPFTFVDRGKSPVRHTVNDGGKGCRPAGGKEPKGAHGNKGGNGGGKPDHPGGPGNQGGPKKDKDKLDKSGGSARGTAGQPGHTGGVGGAGGKTSKEV